MDILLMFLFSVNIVCILYNILIYLKTAIHRVRVYLVRLRLRALKEQREREEARLREEEEAEEESEEEEENREEPQFLETS